MAENHDGRKHGCSMHHHLKHQIFRHLHAQQITANHQMSAAADREKFGKSLHQTQYQCFPIIHFFGFFIIATTTNTMPAKMVKGAITRRRASNIS